MGLSVQWRIRPSLDVWAISFNIAVQLNLRMVVFSKCKHAILSYTNPQTPECVLNICMNGEYLFMLAVGNCQPPMIYSIYWKLLWWWWWNLFLIRGFHLMGLSVQWRIRPSLDVWAIHIENNIVIWFNNQIRVRSRMCASLVTWFCYQMIAKPGNKTGPISWPGPYTLQIIHAKSSLASTWLVWHYRVNSMVLIRQQIIIWTNAGFMSVRVLGWNTYKWKLI